MNENELESMRNSFKTVYNKRKNILNDPQVKNLQEKVIDIRKDSIDNNEKLIETLKESFKKMTLIMLLQTMLKRLEILFMMLLKVKLMKI